MRCLLGVSWALAAAAAMGCSEEGELRDITGSYEIAYPQGRDRLDVLPDGAGSYRIWLQTVEGYRLRKAFALGDEALELGLPGSNDYIRIERTADGSLDAVSGRGLRLGMGTDVSVVVSYDGGHVVPDKTAPSGMGYASIPWDPAVIRLSEPVAEDALEIEGPVVFSAVPIEGSPYVSKLEGRLLDAVAWAEPPERLGPMTLTDPSGNVGSSEDLILQGFLPVVGEARRTFDLAVDMPSVSGVRSFATWCDGVPCIALDGSAGFLLPADVSTLTVRYRMVVDLFRPGDDPPSTLTQDLDVRATAASGAIAVLAMPEVPLVPQGRQILASEWVEATMSLPASEHFIGVTTRELKNQCFEHAPGLTPRWRCTFYLSHVTAE
jgi:hypothetical protein